MRYLRIPLLSLLVLAALALGGPPALASLTAPACDYNGDGYGDLAVGAPGEDVGTIGDAGVVNVLYGSPAGLMDIGDQLWHQGLVGFLGRAESDDKFGSALSCGDYDGDGFDDLAIGAPYEDLGTIDCAGAVNVLYGSAAGLTGAGNQVWHQGLSGVLGAAEVWDEFGGALSSGDFDGDGYEDLAIGASGENVGPIGDAGVVNVLYGSPSGLTGIGDQLWHQGLVGFLGRAESDDEFGEILSSGDYNGDGRDDLAIGTPYEDLGALQDAGAVNVLYGSAAGLTGAGNQVWHQGLSGVLGAAEVWDEFGIALSSGDFNGDGIDDLAIGAGGEDVGAVDSAGAINVIYGSGSGLAGAGNQLWHQDLPEVLGTAEPGDYFGWPLSSGDFDGDGIDDLAIGAATEDVGAIEDAGAVNVLHGSPSGLTAAGDQLWHQGLPGVLGAAEHSDRFGYQLSSGHYDGNGRDDLAIGAPYEDVGAILGAGAANVLYGSSSGLTDVGDQLWHQGLTGVLGEAEGADNFGIALGKR